MKECSKCHKLYSLDCFYLRKKGPRAGQYYEKCKECYKKRGRKYYHANRERQLELALLRRHNRTSILRRFVNEQKKDKPCMDCKRIFPIYVMDYDHRDPSTKIANIGKLGAKGLYTEEKILEEITKCDLVCANCHRIRTFMRSLAQK